MSYFKNWESNINVIFLFFFSFFFLIFLCSINHSMLWERDWFLHTILSFLFYFTRKVKKIHDKFWLIEYKVEFKKCYRRFVFLKCLRKPKRKDNENYEIKRHDVSLHTFAWMWNGHALSMFRCAKHIVQYIRAQDRNWTRDKN